LVADTDKKNIKNPIPLNILISDFLTYEHIAFMFFLT
jgi:hypothetical protein